MSIRPSYVIDDLGKLEKLVRARSMASEKDVISDLVSRELPPIIDKDMLSICLKVNHSLISSICNNSSKYYNKFVIEKSNGSNRIIYAPNACLKSIQWWILDNILTQKYISNNIFGFVPKRNAVQNAKYHLGARHLLNVDIKDFFPSITLDQASNVFSDFGYDTDVSDTLAKICCRKGAVPQGAPTSPAIGNYVLGELDKKLTCMSNDRNIKYSRYADDLTFSSREWIDNEFLMKVEALVNAQGFQLNSSKTRFSGLGNQMEVTGVVINEKIQPPRKWRKRVRAKLNRLESSTRITRSDLSFLFGIKGISNQFSSSVQMKKILDSVDKIISEKRCTVLTYGKRPILPSSLTICEASIMISLEKFKEDSDIERKFGISNFELTKIMKSAFRKARVSSRDDAIVWASKNI